MLQRALETQHLSLEWGGQWGNGTWRRTCKGKCKKEMLMSKRKWKPRKVNVRHQEQSTTGKENPRDRNKNHPAFQCHA